MWMQRAISTMPQTCSVAMECCLHHGMPPRTSALVLAVSSESPRPAVHIQ